MLSLLQRIIAGFTWFVVVAPWEQAVRVRLGKRVTILGAGFYVRLPFVDRIFKQSIRRRLMIIRPQTLTTRDGKVITMGGALGYAIGDLRRMYDTLESAADTIENEAAARVAHFIGTHDAKDCHAIAVQKSVMETLDLAKYGLHGQEFYVTSFASAKTYRFIMGDMPSWNHGDQLRMAERES